MHIYLIVVHVHDSKQKLGKLLALGLECVPFLPDVLSHLSDEINMQEDLSHEMCPHKSESPLRGGDCTTLHIYLIVVHVHDSKQKLGKFLHLA